MKSPIYLVPFDFSEVSKSALKLGIDLAEYNNGSVMMIHIVSKKSEKAGAREKFTEIKNQLSEQHKALVTTKVLVGDIYEDIAKASEILNATMIVMGTHGAKGFQKLFGSHALRLVSTTATPFMITQGGKEIDKMKNIVMPFYFEKESIQIASFAASVAKQFNSTIHLVGFHDKDEWLEGHTRTNQLVVRKYFTDSDVAHEIVNLPKEKSYEKELIQYAVKVDADLIAVAYFNDSLIPTMNSFVQELLENDFKIPVLTVNAEDLTVTSGMSFMTV